MRNRKKPVEPHNIHLRTGDKAVVISGKDKGKIGTVKKVLTAKNSVLVEGVNMITKAQKANPMANIQGGLVKKEAPMESSKLMLYCSNCEKSTRIKYEVRNDKKVRVCKKCGEQLDV